MRLEHLPRGITSFFGWPDILPQVEFKQFKTSCYAVAQASDCTIETFDDCLSDKNYFTAQFVGRAEAVAILCNAIFPYVAFAPGRSHLPHDPVFVSADWLHSAFTGLTSFVPLDADWLNEDICPDHLTCLAEAELKQLAYSRKRRITRTVGHAIFNKWD